ncbi:MAG: hypothetical protein KF760_17130 [Candidatus Eremiobacteraeota bacterium]|nr:hypothetical protein [Candidatus Eremiobacteraeota bacterium]MCW5869026.1 hypothetical protein [Candidatus Eremiobacteraeota bacterium]
MVTQQMRGLSPVHAPRPSKPARPAPPAGPDRAEIGNSVSGGIKFATLAGLCLMAGTSLVQAQVAPQPTNLVSQLESEVTLSDQLSEAAQQRRISLQFEVRPPNRPPVSITPWHAEKIMAEAGTVVVTEVKDGQFDRAAYLTDTTDLVAYLNYMKTDTAENEEEAGAVSLRAFFHLVPNTQIVHPRTQESLSPFTAARLLKEEKPLLLRMDGAPEKQFNNLRELQREVSTEAAPGCTLTDTIGPGKPGVYCFN